VLSLPVITYDLRRRARRRGTYWLRVAVGLAGLLACGLPLASLEASGVTAETGKEVFDGIVAAVFLVCCCGCLLTADAIGSERRDGTLGLLVLTRVRGLDLLLGKLGSAGMTGLCGMAAFFPALMVPVLAGGVTGSEASRKGLALLVTLFLALAIGLWASAIRNDRFKAVRLACIVLVCLAFLPLAFWGYASPPLNYGAAISPVLPAILASDDEYQQTPELYWISLATVVSLASLFLLRASVRLRGNWVDNVTGSFTETRPLMLRLAKRRAAPLKGNRDPLEWLVRHQPGIRKPVWAATALVLIYFVVSGAGMGSLWSLSVAGFWIVYTVASALADALFGAAAGRFFVEARRSGHLELLLTTPAGANLLRSYWRALIKLFLWPVVFLIVADLLHTTLILNTWGTQSTGAGLWSGSDLWWSTQYPVTWGFEIIETLFEISGVCWLAVWLALRGETQLTIAGWAAGLGTGAPLLMKLALWLGLQPFLSQQISNWGWMWPWLVTTWAEQIVCIAYYTAVISFIRRRVTRELSGSTPYTPHQSQEPSLSPIPTM
jgi:hypothetical protein